MILLKKKEIRYCLILTYLNNETWTYECVVTPKEGDYYSKGYEKLFDLNATAWATFNHYDFLKYEITVDMQETKCG